MKFNEEKIKKKLSNVPEENRVWIYNAEIIIEFLNHVFIPTPYFFRPEVKSLPGGEQLTKQHLQPGADKKFSMSAKQLYEKYMWYRENMGYTTPIESYFKFKVIFNKLRCYKNGWEFFKFRRGTDQDVWFGPLLTREEAGREVSEKFPIPQTNVAAGQVDVSLQDLESEPQKTINPQTEIKHLDEGQYISE